VTTFADAAKAYLDAGGERKYIWRETEEGAKGLAPYFGKKLLSSITQNDLDAAAVALCAPGSTRETLIRNVYTPFVAVWRFASSASRKMAEPRQWERPRKAKGTAVRSTTTRSGTKPVSYERAWQFVSAMSPAPAMVMTTLFYTGMRPIELFALQCEDINIDGRWITVQSSKTGAGRGVPMHEVLVPLLRVLSDRRGSALFLTRHGEPYPITDDEHHGQMKGAISGARGRLESAGTIINDVSPYTARHTVSTQLVMAGVHPHIKDQILGHAADDMSRHYTNLPQAPLIEAINKLPIVAAWSKAEWLVDPLTWQSKLLRWENHGRRGAPKMEAAE
jgi:integrase